MVGFVPLWSVVDREEASNVKGKERREMTAGYTQHCTLSCRKHKASSTEGFSSTNMFALTFHSVCQFFCRLPSMGILFGFYCTCAHACHGRKNKAKLRISSG